MSEADELAALERERDAYTAQGKTARAKEVAAEIRVRSGQEAEDAPKGRRSAGGKQTAEASAPEQG